MSSHLDRFRAFCQTASFWQGKLAGVQQFQLSNFDFSHLADSSHSLVLPNIPVDTVLGKRAEFFFQFCVEQSSNYELLVANEQIFQGKTTLGELDYILLERSTGQLIHVELVYKFYIYEPGKIHDSSNLSERQNHELSAYVGPNRRDYFIKKMDHLISHQLPLLGRQETALRLAKLGIPVTNIKQQVCFLAHVFIPRSAWQNDFPFLNKKCIVGYYMDEFAFAKAKTTNLYFLLEKKEWKIQPESLQVELSHENALERVTESLRRGFAPMLWMQLPDKSFERFFVVAAV